MSLSLKDLRPEIQELFEMAQIAKLKAYCIYSNFSVGAAIRLTSGQSFSGCNVENASFGATVCAERVAIQNAVSQLGTIRIACVVVLTDAKQPWAPCGLCRQVIAEFSESTVVYFGNIDGHIERRMFSELFPDSFSQDCLSTQ